MPVSIKPSPIIRGEAAKRLLESMDNPKDNSGLLKKCEELSKIFKSEFTTNEGHLDLDEAFSEIKFLYNTYGLENVENLTEDAKVLKDKILTFVEEIRRL